MIIGMEEFGIMAEKLFTAALLKIVENPEIALNLLQALDVDKELDFINIPVPVLDLGIAWDNLAESNGWKIQQNKITKHACIIDNKRIRREWGTVNGMYKVMAAHKTIMATKIPNPRTRPIIGIKYPDGYEG